MKRAQFLKTLAEFGATLDTECEFYDLNIDAPKGKVFKDNGCHCICEPFRNIGESWKAQAYSTAAARVELGTEDCSNPDCDVCS
jgi:hypothetical protein